jgi:hypothetical protein
MRTSFRPVSMRRGQWHSAMVMLVALVGTATQSGRAQGTASDTRDLVISMVSQLFPEYAGQPTVTFGRGPTGASTGFSAPRGATVQATVAWPNGTVVLGSVAGSEDSVLDRYERDMVAAGWTVAGRGSLAWQPTQTIQAGPGAGATSSSRSYGGASASVGDGNPALFFCRTGARLALTISQRAPGPMRFTLASVERDPYSSDCGAPSGRGAGGRGAGGLPAGGVSRGGIVGGAAGGIGARGIGGGLAGTISILGDLPNAAASGGCRVSSGGRSERSGSPSYFSMNATPDSVLRYFGTHLASDGWTILPKEAAAVGVWRQVDPTRVTQTATVFVERVPQRPDCWAVSVHIDGSR